LKLEKLNSDNQEKINRCVERGLDFIESFASERKNLDSFAADIIFLFHHISETTDIPKIRQSALQKGKRAAECWRKIQRVPRKSYQLICTLIAEQAASDLGCRDELFRQRLHRKLSEQVIMDVLGFDPRLEPPPQDLTDDCKHCGVINQRGRYFCQNCRKKLEIISKYDVWLNALVVTHHLKVNNLLGKELYAETIKWMTKMRPYPKANPMINNEAWEAVYAVTHVIFTLNDYGQKKLSQCGLEAESYYLKKALAPTLQGKDCDLLGECVESLIALGLSRNGRVLKSAVHYLENSQNPDGSWGALDIGPHQRMHTTWTAMDAIRSYARKKSPTTINLVLDECRNK